MRKVSSDHKIRYAVAGITLAVLLLVLFLPAATVRWVAAAVLILAAVAACAFVKKRSILSFNKRQVLYLLLVIAALYLMLLYLTGVHYGFYKNIYQFSFSTFLRYILPIALIIIATEVVRAVLIGEKGFGVWLITFFTCFAAEICVGTSIDAVQSMNSLMELLAMSAIPAITSNILYQYISKRYGAYPIIGYRLILALYGYIIPFTVATPPVFVAFAGFLLPLFVLLFIDLLYEKKKKLATKRKSPVGWVLWGAVAAVMISVVMLISCQFRYGILVIATESMTGSINKGDAIVFEEYRGQSIEKGDVVVFEKSEDVKVVHRVVNIYQIGGQTRYVTKGDANKDDDHGYITDAEIVGVVQFRLIYVGVPTIWVHDMFE